MEVAQIPIDPALDLSKIGRLGEAFDVKEFIDGLQVGEAGDEGLCANAFEAGLEIEARGESLDGDADS